MVGLAITSRGDAGGVKRRYGVCEGLAVLSLRGGTVGLAAITGIGSRKRKIGLAVIFGIGVRK